MSREPGKTARILPFRARSAFARPQAAKDEAAGRLRARLAAGTPATPPRMRLPRPGQWRGRMAWALIGLFVLALLLGSRAFGAR